MRAVFACANTIQHCLNCPKGNSFCCAKPQYWTKKFLKESLRGKFFQKFSFQKLQRLARKGNSGETSRKSPTVNL